MSATNNLMHQSATAMDITRPNFKRDEKLRFYRRLMLAILCFAGGSYLILQIEPALPVVDKNAVWVGDIQFGDFVRDIRGTGVLSPKETRWIATAVSGKVERILIKPGTWVEPDTIIAELSNPEVVQEMEESQWKIEELSAESISTEADLRRQLIDARIILESVRSDYQSALLEANAERELAELGIGSRIRFQQTDLRVSLLQKKLALEEKRVEQLDLSTQAQLNASKARVQQNININQKLAKRVESLTIRAGVSGVLQRVDVDEGQQVIAGANIGRVAHPAALIAELKIPEGQARELKTGLPAKLDLRGTSVNGTVVRIDPAVMNGTVQVDIEMTGKIPDGIRPDLSVEGTIELERISNALFSKRLVNAQPHSQFLLFRLDGQGYANKVQVEFGRASINAIEIKSGLNPGDQIILSDTMEWAQFERIQLK